MLQSLRVTWTETYRQLGTEFNHDPIMRTVVMRGDCVGKLLL